MNEEIYALWFNRIPFLGLRSKYQLFLNYQSFEALYRLDWNELVKSNKQVQWGHNQLTKEIYEQHRQTISVDKDQAEFLQQKQVTVLHPLHPNFPVLLKDLPDCPINIYAQGNTKFPKVGIGIVGSRRCSGYGKKVATYMAYELAKVGVNVVSGLAYGIDVTAHQGALQAKGFTTAVLGGGIHACYPSTHQHIFEQISESGCVLSEEPFGTLTLPYMFPKRNRIISGICQGVLVVEAAQKSGSLITVDFALEQGREVFTVPNRLFELGAEGTNNLIKQGAKLVFHIDDILSEIACQFEVVDPNPSIQEKKLDEKEKIVYSCISYDPSHEESIIEAVFGQLSYQVQLNIEDNLGIDSDNREQRIDIDEIHLCLIQLEMKGLIKKISSCYYARSEG